MHVIGIDIVTQSFSLCLGTYVFTTGPYSTVSARGFYVFHRS